MNSRKGHGAQEWRENYLQGTDRVDTTERKIKSDQRGPLAYEVTVGFCYSSFYEVMWTELGLPWNEEYVQTVWVEFFFKDLSAEENKDRQARSGKLSKRLSFVITENLVCLQVIGKKL